MLEKLHGFLVLLRGRSRFKGAQISSFTSVRILLPRVQAITTGLQFSNHCLFLTIGQNNADFPVTRFYLERFQLDLSRAIGHLSSANIKTRVMPRALDIKSVKAAFGQRPEAVRAKLLEGVELVADLSEGYHLFIDFHA